MIKVVIMLQIYFRTNRLIARQLKLSDLEQFHTMQSNMKVMKYTLGRTKTKEENAAELKNIISEYTLSEPNKIVMGLSEVSDVTCTLIGTCAITSLDEEFNEVGYRLLEESWGNGYGREILEGLLTYCFDDLKVKKVKAEVEKENIYSVRILESSLLNYVREYYEGDNLVRLYVIEKD
ncbi:GNAT family N-acetyltransferase [Halobacillus sp. KGW1]|uniref:GNAT family N-acetyltransferase n=1 Tax=Halobacillus sp. KGW1 TaxID=1793726 RepID=UPI000785A295|nr:GNAT family N-acetyltransferase [Halobacillus sp. KGW1]